LRAALIYQKIHHLLGRNPQVGWTIRRNVDLGQGGKVGKQTWGRNALADWLGGYRLEDEVGLIFGDGDGQAFCPAICGERKMPENED